MQSFKDLLVWQQAMGLARDCYLLTSDYPRAELFGTTSQIRRSAASVPANIAEGTARRSRRDYIQFLRIAQGSLRELETHHLLSLDVGLAEAPRVEPVLARLDSVARLLANLVRALQPEP